MVLHLEEYKQNFIKEHGEQTSNKFFEDYLILFGTPQFLMIIFKGVALIALITTFLSNVNFIHLDLLQSNFKDMNYVYHLKDYGLLLWGFWQFLVCASLCVLYHFLKIIRFFLVLLIIVPISVFLILMSSVQIHYNIYIGFFNSIFYFYYLITYLYFTEFTITRLRNATTSVFYFTVAMTLLVQIFVVREMKRTYIFTGIIYDCFLIIVFILFEFFLIKMETKDLGLHEIEKYILGLKKS